MSTKDPEKKQGAHTVTGPNAHDSPQACSTLAWDAHCSDRIQYRDGTRPSESSASPEREFSEQRIKSRFKAYALAVTLTRSTCLGLVRRSHKTLCVDINRYGVGLISPAPLPQGSRISLDFQGKYINQSAVQAEVVSQAPLSGGGYRLGIRFLYCAYQKAYCRRLDNALSRIEAMCRQKNMGQQKSHTRHKPLSPRNSHFWHSSGSSY